MPTRVWWCSLNLAFLLTCTQWLVVADPAKRSKVIGRFPGASIANFSMRNRRPKAFLHRLQSLQANIFVIPTKSVEIDEPIPLVLQPWVHLYRSLPTLQVPFTNLDITFTLASMICLTCIDYFSAHLIHSMSGWPALEVRKVAGSITSIFHSTVLVAGLGACLMTERYTPSNRMGDHPVWWQDAATALIQFCSGYMLYDAFVQFLVDRWVPGSGPVLATADWLFLGHHAATLLYMTSARLIRAGHMSAMILMFFGEITAPIMNLLRISQTAALLDSAVWLQNLHPTIEYIFAILYVIFRVFIGPVCGVHLTFDLLVSKEGRANVPVLLSLVWLAMCWGVMIGSLPWIKNALKILDFRGEAVT